MKFKKWLSIFWIMLMLFASSVSFYVGVKSFGETQQTPPTIYLKKPFFEEKEWRSLVDSTGKLDQFLFQSALLRRLDLSQKIENIWFEFDKNKVVVNIIHNQHQYKWFYNLVQNFVI